MTTIENKSIVHDRITDKIRVSTAVIKSDCNGWSFFVYETWCFSEDPKQKTFQKIHGTDSVNDDERQIARAKKIHGYIVDNLHNKIMMSEHRALNPLYEGVPEAPLPRYPERDKDFTLWPWEQWEKQQAEAVVWVKEFLL